MAVEFEELGPSITAHRWTYYGVLWRGGQEEQVLEIPCRNRPRAMEALATLLGVMVALACSRPSWTAVALGGFSSGEGEEGELELCVPADVRALCVADGDA